MNPTDMLNPVSTAVSTAFKGAESFIELLKKWRQYRISDIATLRMLYLELDGYMEVLELLELKYFRGPKANAGTITKLLSGVQLPVTGLILANEEEYGVFRKMMKRGMLDTKKHRNRRRDYENVLQALSFIYSKTHALKTIAETEDRVLVKEIKLRERVENIVESITMVMKVLVTFREVNIIARRWHID
ncbi:MAG: hypothetical protein JW904_01505 [Spirochaetales bacterium]|nr:hypothetical protein [Spirochaetales bacterium]